MESSTRGRSWFVLAGAALLGGALFACVPCWAGPIEPSSFDPDARLLPLDRVAVAEMGPVDVRALFEEDEARELHRQLFGEWLEIGGPLPSPLVPLLDARNRERFGGWLTTGGPIPGAVLEQLDEGRASATLALETNTPVPAALLEELPELKRLLWKKERVGYPMAALTGEPRARRNIEPSNSGTWETLSGGNRIWRLRVRSENARWLVLGFRTFRPHPGARLYVYAPECASDPGCGKLLGPFTEKDIREHRQLWTPPIDGDELIVELYWPGGLEGIRPDIVLGTVSHGYKAPWPRDDDPPATTANECKQDKGLGDSGPCNVDIACEPDWSKEKRGVVHLLLYGSSWCSASLINNTDLDCTPYVLTARHCIDNSSEAAGTTLRFKYERANCGSGAAPTNNVLTGSSLRATWSTTDFTLLEMNQAPPASFEAYFNGWSRVDDPTQFPGATGIHHPSGDAKKISFELDGVIYGQSSGYGPDHWRIPDWNPTAHGEGTTEGGSSGSPLFDTPDPIGDEPHIIGQLHGGLAACFNSQWDEYGRFDLSWNGGGSVSSRLADWLDPGQPVPSASPTTFGGLDHAVCLNPLPELSFAELFVSDALGNNNGFPEPSEEIDLRISIENSGSAPATGVEGTLSTTKPGVTITHDTAIWRTIAAGGTQTSEDPPFRVAIGGDFPCDLAGELIPLTLSVSYDQSTIPERMRFELRVGVPVPDEIFADDLEPEQESGWRSSGSGGGGWSLIDSADPDDYSSPTHSWYAEDVVTASQASLTMPAQPPDHPLTSMIDVLPDHARLRFQHRFLTENNIDGGVLEYSVDGAVNWHDITYDLATGETKNRFIANGYNGHSLALSNRAAWEGDSGGWQQVEVDLSDFAGEVLALRFLFVTNDGNVVDVDGWYIDDVSVEYTKYTCPILGPPAEVTGLLLGRPAAGRVSMSYDAPPYGAGVGGPVEAYTIQTASLPGPIQVQFHLNLGNATSTEMSADQLPEGQGLLIVGENAQGPGPTGTDSEGNPRPPAEPTP